MLRRMRWVVLPEETGDASSQRTPRRCVTSTAGNGLQGRAREVANVRFQQFAFSAAVRVWC